ncbi:dynein axonemal assembly factor 8 [Acomys russatus]|uniref:dynein axonemal assembly factor 8 n=1 Tax=Acomys russatus TaxID=60746 RepID=UPI0021E301AA|nr:dynein axonemal assembly factor 8 [Acomys russatus]
MASKDKAVVSLPVSPWDAILKAAKDQLPSLDSDSSLSDCEEEEPFIFQRNQPFLIPDLAEDLDEDPVGVDEFGTWVSVERSSSSEPLLLPGRLAIEPRSEERVKQKDLAPQERRGPGWSCQSCVESSPILVDAEEVPPRLEGNLRSPSNPSRSQSPPWHSQGEEATFPLEGELKMEPPDTDVRDSEKRRALRRERRKMIEREILQKVTRATQSPACGDQHQAAESGPWPEAASKQCQERWPVLSLQHLEGWDLDYILQSLPGQQDSRGDSACRTAWWLADRWQNQGLTTGLSQDTLLEQLSLLGATQSRVCNPTWKISADKLQYTDGQEARSRSASAKPGFQTEPVLKPKTEPPTIFIDLRQTEPSEPQARQSQESSEHSSSDSEEEEEEEEEETAGSVASSRERRDCTGKSQLLQQLRAFRKATVPSQLSASDSPGDQKAPAAGDTAESQTGRKKPIKLWAEEQNALDLRDPLRT